jgi:radical SAM protein with 4Fe4S-binding SPASM domain
MGRNKNMDINKAQEYLVHRISPAETYSDLLSFPRYLEIETVNACNARCPMCTINDWHHDSQPMTEELFTKVAAEAIAHAPEIKRVSLYRNGEPLLDPKLAHRTALLKKSGIKSVAISTNVSLLNEKRSQELLEAGLDIIIMSIDSLKKEVYESIRKKLLFEEVMANALRFIELRNRIRPQTKIWLRMIRQSSNKNEWPEYEAYWHSRLSSNDRVYYHHIFNWGGQLNGYKPLAPSLEPQLPCVALWSLLVILCNGDVPLCNVDYNNRFPLGNVTNSSIADLWRSKLQQHRQELHLTGQKASISLCGNCNVWDESPDLGGISTIYSGNTDLKLD